MEKRTPDELVPYVEGFLNELYVHFGTNGRVSFKELSIKKTGKKYRIHGRLRCEIMKAEFDESHRQYKRKYNTSPTREAILSWIECAGEIEAKDKRNYRTSDNNRERILLLEKERRKGRKEEIREFNYNYYKKNKPRIDEKFKTDKYYEKNKDRINAKRNARRALLRKLKKNRIESIVRFDKEFELARTYVESYLSQVAYHNREDLKDLMQDVYLEARASFHRYSGTSKFTTWLVKIGINTNLQRLKKKRLWNSKFILTDEFSESILEVVERHSASELEEKENEIEYPENGVTIIENCIGELTDVQREHLELFIEGKSHAEMAEMLDITPEYSKTRLRIIRQQLAKKIEPKLNVKIKSYTDSTETINRTAHKKTYHERYLKKNK